MSLPRLLKEAAENLFKKPATLPFPKEDIPPAPGYRGLHRVDASKCISCGLCAIDCPTKAIEMRVYSEYGNKRYPVVHYYRCVFCYQCVISCPKKAYVITETRPPPIGDKERLIGEPIFKKEEK